MVEEQFVASAEVIESRFTFRRGNNPVLGAFAVASKAHVALAAIARKRDSLVEPELFLRSGVHQQRERLFHDVAEPVFRKHEVVVGIEIAFVLHGHGCAASLAGNAKALVHAQPAFQRHVESLNEMLAHVIAHPFVKDRA
jgi:hypothetical protein